MVVPMKGNKKYFVVLNAHLDGIESTESRIEQMGTQIFLTTQAGE